MRLELLRLAEVGQVLNTWWDTQGLSLPCSSALVLFQTPFLHPAGVVLSGNRSGNKNAVLVAGKPELLLKTKGR